MSGQQGLNHVQLGDPREFPAGLAVRSQVLREPLRKHGVGAVLAFQPGLGGPHPPYALGDPGVARAP